MSDLMYDEVGVKPGLKYNKGDWTQYAVHDEDNIKGFFGPYIFLSNFHPNSPCYYDGDRYNNSEAAYQAAKIVKDQRKPFFTMAAYQSKKDWKKYDRIDKTPEEWDARKYEVMCEVVFSKFLINKDLRQKLIDTDRKYLEEKNHWGDTYYGYDIVKGGKNILGKILMNTRQYWINSYGE